MRGRCWSIVRSGGWLSIARSGGWWSIALNI